MKPCFVVGFLLLTACPSSNTTRADAALGDARVADADPLAPDATPPHRHTIAIDGSNDFDVGESFPTTSPTYGAYVSWDDNNLYLGYSGEDISPTAPDSSTKWVLYYFDTDPGTGSGAYLGEMYNSQQPDFPDGFGAEYYYRWKSDDSFEDLQSFAGGDSWNVEELSLDAGVSGSFMEVAIPRTALGDPALLGIVSFMINEKPDGEWTYAGLYTGNFTDGYHATLPLSLYLAADFASAAPPNDESNQGP